MQKNLSIYNFKEKETIASIGTSSVIWEIWFASQLKGLILYLRDIDDQNCNQQEINEGVAYFQKLVNKKIRVNLFPSS